MHRKLLRFTNRRSSGPKSLRRTARIKCWTPRRSLLSSRTRISSATTPSLYKAMGGTQCLTTQLPQLASPASEARHRTPLPAFPPPARSNATKSRPKKRRKQRAMGPVPPTKATLTPGQTRSTWRPLTRRIGASPPPRS